MSVEEKIAQLEYFFDKLNKRGMEGFSGTVWPVIIRRYFYDQSPFYEYVYPRAFFDNLRMQINTWMFFEKKSDRLILIKTIVDKHMNGEIDIFLYHFGMFCIYSDSISAIYKGDFSEASIGKKRALFVQSLPSASFKNTDDFISSVWSYQIERRSTDIGEHTRNPYMSQVRILFNPDKFGSLTGLYHFDVDWVEPISGKLDLQCNKWSGVHDPMAPLEIPKGWVEGPIILGHEGFGNGLRHFVQGEPLHAGGAIQVKFGGGWIKGRYEWSFDKESPIQIHAGPDIIHIREGHTVRIKS